MALANVTQEILKSADDRAAAIKAQADAEIAKINADADAKISEMKDKEDKKLKEAVERLSRQELSSAELESKKIVLAKKKELLTEAFDGTLADLENASSDVKLEQYKAMVEAAKKVIANPKALISENDSFSAADLGVSEVVKDSRIKAGLILQSEDGQVEVDMQYSTILQEIWDREIRSVSEILFR
ncbi:MAG: V-type ATP synthase subunit E family protein [Candidatus Methanomethylophilaceae archaeon]|nr:V-type ATP synthase subunit E family protein [Candidatus Methanomethylophilaceae archaeon]